MKVLITVRLDSPIGSKEKTYSHDFTCDFRNDREQPGYPLLLRAWGKEADKLFSFREGENILVYGSLWSRTKHNLGWIDVDFATQTNEYINHFFGIGKVFKQPSTMRGLARFPLVVNRTIEQKHYYSIASVGSAASVAQSLLLPGDIVSLEGYIDLINWADKEGAQQHFLRFTNTIIKRF